MSTRFPMPIPFGWFFVSYGDELAPGTVKPLRYFGRDLVLFRTESGRAVLLDAYCPHLGAHLGYGGRIEGESIRCPFHGWAYAADGRCVDVPYAKRIPPLVAEPCIRTYPLVERNEVVWAWYHPSDEPPSFDVAAHPEVGHDDWVELDRYLWSVRSIPQEIAENGVDPAHFRYVHGMDSVPEGETTYSGVVRRSIVAGSRTLTDPDGRVRSVESRVETVQNGAGQKWSRLTGLSETLLMVLVTPVTDEEVELRFAFTRRRFPAGSFEEKVALESIASTARGVEDDIRIWDHKVYRPRPVLCDGDGPIPRFRQYFAQFYVER
jgi:phenylpropionate dioxygenase-like ring-hydroxylating dioxygenase large terminal subunit